MEAEFGGGGGGQRWRWRRGSEAEAEVKVKLENESVKLENHEKKVKVKLENESVVEKLNVKLLIHGSVVQEVDRAPVVLALVDPFTGFCHGIADIVREDELQLPAEKGSFIVIPATIRLKINISLSATLCAFRKKNY